MARVLLDEPAFVGALTVRGTLATAPVPLSLNATSITVTAGGRWLAGSAVTPHPAPLDVTLRGTSRLVLVEGNGSVSLFGPVPQPVFTTLLDGADAGSNSVTLASTTDWRTGDEVLVTHSGFHAVDPGPFTFPPGDRGRTERFSVVGVTPAALSLNEPLATLRLGVLDAGVPVDVRAEVANLTRRIVIAGAEDADWTDGGVGVQVQLANNPGPVTLSGVRIERAGIRGLGPGTERPALRLVASSLAVQNRLTGSVIVNAASRGVVLDLVSNAVITDNVITRVRGHGLWLTTGLERDNLIERNLVTQLSEPAFNTFTTSTEFRSLPANPSAHGACGASGFVITNPDNVLRDNVAADLPGCGFWLSFARQPRGLGAAVDLAPNRVAFGTFDGNTSRSTNGPGVLLGSGITEVTPGVLGIEDVTYSPQADERRSASEDFQSMLGATFVRTRVLTAWDGALRFVGKRTTVVAPVVWNHGGNGFLSVNGEASMSMTNATFVGRLGPVIQPLAAPTLTWVSGPYFPIVTGARIAHYRASPVARAGGALFTTGVGLFAFDRTLGAFSQVSSTDVNLGVRGPRPGARLEMTGPILDGPGFAGFPGRWWVDSLPYFTQGYTCAPAPRDTLTSGEVCAAPGYFSMFGVRVATAGGANDTVAAELVRETSGSPAVGTRASMDPNDRDEALPVPNNETVRLRFPAYAVTPRQVRLVTWGRPGERALLRIAYPATTTFVVELRNEHNLHFVGYQPVTMTAASSLAQVTSDPAGTRYYFDGAFLNVSLRADWPNLGPYSRHALIINATGPGLP